MATIKVASTIKQNGEWWHDYSVLPEPVQGLDRIVSLAVSNGQYEQLERIGYLNPSKFLASTRKDLGTKIAVIRDSSKALMVAAIDILDEFNYTGGKFFSFKDRSFSITGTTIEIFSEAELPSGCGSSICQTETVKGKARELDDTMSIVSRSQKKGISYNKRSATAKWITGGK